MNVLFYRGHGRGLQSPHRVARPPWSPPRTLWDSRWPLWLKKSKYYKLEQPDLIVTQVHHTNAVFEPRVVPRWEQLMGIPCKRKDEMDEKKRMQWTTQSHPVVWDFWVAWRCWSWWSSVPTDLAGIIIKACLIIFVICFIFTLMLPWTLSRTFFITNEN